MWRGVTIGWAVVLSTVMLTACSRSGHGRFGRENSDGDTLTMEEIYALQQRVMAAESTVMAEVRADTASHWAQPEFGWWYKYTHKSDSHMDYMGFPPMNDSICTIREQVYDLSGDTLLLDAVREFDPKQNGPFSYEMMLYELVHDDTIEMLVPWNMAYGKTGGMNIEPYTNVRVLLTRHTTPATDVEPTEEGV